MPQVLLIARRIELAKTRIDNLFQATDDPVEKGKLGRQRLRLDKEYRKLVGYALDQNSEAYLAATEALGRANRELSGAIADLERVANAVESISSAVSFIESLTKSL